MGGWALSVKYMVGFLSKIGLILGITEVFNGIKITIVSVN